jgi:hypothetical protein
MDLAQVRKVLAYASSTDPRVRRNDPDERELQVASWAAQIGAYDVADARVAVDRHYADPKADALLPGQLRALIAGIRSERLAARPEPLPDADPDDPVAYRAALKANRAAIASGAIVPPPAVRQLPAAVLDARYGRLTRRMPPREEAF